MEQSKETGRRTEDGLQREMGAEKRTKRSVGITEKVQRAENRKKNLETEGKAAGKKIFNRKKIPAC